MNARHRAADKMGGELMLRKSLLISAAPFLALFGAPVHAQDSASESREASPSLAPIVVTAQKREQALQDVPISIAALGMEQLENQQINDLLDIVGDVPNVFINNFNGRPGVVRLFIRGLGQNDVSLTQDPSVALYTDGVYVGTSVGAAFELTDLERIEILRGPQGTLYGRNSTGGAINLISAKPKLQEPDGAREYSAG
jgi:iron complex outermembrane recepter protein